MVLSTPTVATGTPDGIETIGQQRVEPVQAGEADGHTDHGQRGRRCHHPRQVAPPAPAMMAEALLSAAVAA